MFGDLLIDLVQLGSRTQTRANLNSNESRSCNSTTSYSPYSLASAEQSLHNPDNHILLVMTLGTPFFSSGSHGRTVAVLLGCPPILSHASWCLTLACLELVPQLSNNDLLEGSCTRAELAVAAHQLLKVHQFPGCIVHAVR